MCLSVPLLSAEVVFGVRYLFPLPFPAPQDVARLRCNPLECEHVGEVVG